MYSLVGFVHAAPVFALQQKYLGVHSTWEELLENNWIHLRFFGTKDYYQDRTTWELSNFEFKTIQIRFVCNNHIFNLVFFYIWQYFLFDSISLRLSSLWFLNCELHHTWVCVGIILQSTTRWKGYFSRIFPTSYMVITFGQHLLLGVALQLSAFSCFKVLWSSWSFSMMSSRLIPLLITQLEPFYSFLHYLNSGQEDLDISNVHHVLQRPSTSSQPCGEQQATSSRCLQ